MRPNCAKDREALRDKLLDTYDDTLQRLFGDAIPRRSVRFDVVQACVEAFDFIVKLIANSNICIEDVIHLPQGTNRKAYCRKNCERCIRSYVYTALEHEKIAAKAAKENEA